MKAAHHRFDHSPLASAALSAVLANWLASVLLLLPVACGPALAFQNSAFATPSAKTQSSVVKLGGRKGTRSYEPAVPGAATEPSESEAQSAETAKARLDQCIATWDHGTHITPSNWRRICERQLKAGE